MSWDTIRIALDLASPLQVGWPMKKRMKSKSNSSSKRNEMLASLLVAFWPALFLIVAVILKTRYGAVGNLIGQYLFWLSPLMLVVGVLVWHKRKLYAEKQHQERDADR
ncbi:MAG TPA: hypothetical protein VN229_19830 [Terriglobales bacterium]|nr:hypothetical protein [Terriglobales bacterium]